MGISLHSINNYWGLAVFLRATSGTDGDNKRIKSRQSVCCACIIYIWDRKMSLYTELWYMHLIREWEKGEWKRRLVGYTVKEIEWGRDRCGKTGGRAAYKMASIETNQPSPQKLYRWAWRKSSHERATTRSSGLGMPVWMGTSFDSSAHHSPVIKASAELTRDSSRTTRATQRLTDDCHCWLCCVLLMLSDCQVQLYINITKPLPPKPTFRPEAGRTRSWPF